MNRNKMFAECRVWGDSANLCLRSAPDSALGKPFFYVAQKKEKKMFAECRIGECSLLVFLSAITRNG